MSEIRKYATATTLLLPLRKFGLSDLAVSADWTPVSGGAAGTDDVLVSIDGAAFANATNAPTCPNGCWQLSLTAGELTGARIVVKIVDDPVKVIDDHLEEIVTFGHASAFYPDDYRDLLIGTPGAGGLAGDIAALEPAGDPWATPLPGAYGAGEAGQLVGDYLDAAVSGRAAAGDAMTLTAAANNAVATALMDLAAAVDGYTPRQVLRLLAAGAGGETDGAPAGPFHVRDLANTKNRVTAAVDEAGNRLTVTYDLS